jgi:CoA:oxalate CoA-transferase
MMPSGALRGLRVLDLTQFLSGPFCTMILGDLGADVIKVESPEGDLTRSLPPYFVGQDSAYYLHVNRNKRDIVVDLKTDAGRDIVAQLISKCDVLVENFRPGVLDKLGIRYEDFAEQQPGLIWCSISGYGQTGPYRNRPAYDMVVQAISGAMSLTGEPDGRPVRLGVPMGDLSAGMYGAIGILAALDERNRTSRGQRIDVGMLDSLISLLSYQGAYAMLSGVAPQAQGRGHDSIPTYRAFVCADGRDIVVTANTERMWRGLCKALGLEELTSDPRFVTNRDRFEHQEELWPLLETAFGRMSAKEAEAALIENAVPAAVINNVLDAMNDEHVRAREMMLPLDTPDGRHVEVLGNPIRMEGTPREGNLYPPMLGEQTREVLRELLALDDKRIDDLVTEGAVYENRTLQTVGAGEGLGTPTT